MDSSRVSRLQQGFSVALVTIALLGAGLITLATRNGAVADPDSAVYIGTAHSLVTGNGLVIPYGEEHPARLVRWPPLYPLVLACLGVSIPDLLVAGRWLSIFLFFLNIILIGRVVYRFTRSRVLGAAASVLFALLPPMIEIHTMIMSEPLFLFLLFVQLDFLERYLKTAKLLFLVLSGIAAGLSVITRFAALPIIFAGAFTLLLFSPSHVSSRVRHAAIWALLASVPVTAVFLLNFISAGTISHRSIVWHPPPKGFYWGLRLDMAHWFLPGTLAESTRVQIITILGPSFVLMWMFRMIRRRTAASVLFSMLALSYGAFLMFNVYFADSTMGLGITRILTMEFVFSILVAASLLADSGAMRNSTARYAVLVVCGALVALKFHDVVQYTRDLRNNGGAITARVWRDSPGISFVGHLPPQTIVYTDWPEPIYLLTKKTSQFVPWIRDADSGLRLPSQEIHKAISRVCEQVTSGRAVVIYFRALTIRAPYLIAPTDLAARCGFSSEISFDDALRAMAFMSHGTASLSRQK